MSFDDIDYKEPLESEARVDQFCKILVASILTFLPILSQAASPRADGEQLRAELPCVLEWILQIRKLPFNPAFPLPNLILDTETTLKSYQDDVEPQWNIRPDSITNVFIARKNRIYLTTDPVHYKPKERFIEDSLAHELFHYVQVFYDGIPVDQFSDFEEVAAIDIQNRFREKYKYRLESGFSLCESSTSFSAKLAALLSFPAQTALNPD